MKTIKVLLAAALFAGLATLSIAGPGPQYWAQQTKDAKERQAKQEQAQTQSKSDTQAPACAHCSGCADMKKS